MKTLTILLFSALSLTACATDDRQDPDPIDKESEPHRQLETFQGTDSIHLNGRGQRDVQEGLGGNADWIDQLFVKARPLDTLQIADADAIKAVLVAERLTIKGVHTVKGPIEPERERIKDLTSGRTVENGEWAEEILVNGNSYTLIHAPAGHVVVDVAGNAYVE